MPGRIEEASRDAHAIYCDTIPLGDSFLAPCQAHLVPGARPAYYPGVSQRLFTIFLSVALALQLWLGAGPRLVCLGGGGDFPTALPTSSELSADCEHADFLPIAPPSDEPHVCDCIDVELNVAELQSLASPGTIISLVVLPVPTDALSFLASVSTVTWTSRPEPPWFDPRLERQLTVVNCARLTI